MPPETHTYSFPSPSSSSRPASQISSVVDPNQGPRKEEEENADGDTSGHREEDYEMLSSDDDQDRVQVAESPKVGQEERAHDENSGDVEEDEEEEGKETGRKEENEKAASTPCNFFF